MTSSSWSRRGAVPAVLVAACEGAGIRKSYGIEAVASGAAVFVYPDGRRGAVLRAVASHEAGGPYGADDEYDDNGDLVCPEPPVASLTREARKRKGAICIGCVLSASS